MVATALGAQTMVVTFGIYGAAYLQILVYIFQAVTQLILVMKFIRRS